MIPPPPLSDIVRLHQIGQGVTHTLEPDAATRAAIARSLDMAELSAFSAEVGVAPVGQGWRVSGRVRAEGAQTCGITLEPLPITVDQTFTVDVVEAAETPPDEIEVDLDEEGADVAEDGQVDLGAYAVEQLALALDPFPRKPGVEFEQPPEPAEVSPFAVLLKLRPEDDGDKG